MTVSYKKRRVQFQINFFLIFDNMPGGFKLRSATRRPKDDNHGAMRPEGAAGSSKRTLVNVADCRDRMVFKAKKIISQQLRNSEVFNHIEWKNILVNTREPAKHLDSEDGRDAIATWEAQAQPQPAVRGVV